MLAVSTVGAVVLATAKQHSRRPTDGALPSSYNNGHSQHAHHACYGTNVLSLIMRSAHTYGITLVRQKDDENGKMNMTTVAIDDDDDYDYYYY